MCVSNYNWILWAICMKKMRYISYIFTFNPINFGYLIVIKFFFFLLFESKQ